MAIVEVFQQYSEQVSDMCILASSHADGHTDYSNSDDYGSEHRDKHMDCPYM